MKVSGLIAGPIFFLLNSATSMAQTPVNLDHSDSYFQISKTTNRLISNEEVMIPDEEIAAVAFQTQPKSSGVDPMAIIDALFKLWDIVKEGAPVATVDYKIAKALPVISEGNWQQLTGWKSERVSNYAFSVVNMMGMKTVDLEYQVKLRYGGSVGGKGRFIAHAYAKPTKVSVSWGYNLDVTVSVPSVVNIGTNDDPLAAINMDVTYKVSTVLRSYSESKGFEFHGDGSIREDGHQVFEPASR